VTYVRNVWYMAAWESEVPDETFLARTLLDERRLIVRRSDGGYSVLADRCPHRFAPLSKGRREGDRIICGYHGLEFGFDGKCIRSPFSDLIPPNARVSAWPAVGRHGGVWFWPGDPALAHPDTIPDFAFIDQQEGVQRGRTMMNANYELVADNLMDLSHAEFLHTESFGLNGAMFTGQYKASQDESGAIWSNWWLPGIPPPAWATSLVPEGSLVDEWTEMRWNAPASMALFIGIARAGTDRQEMVAPAMANPHIITPETPASSHYFFTCDPGEDALAMAQQVFDNEDHPMIEAVQNSLQGRDFWEEHPVILNVDAGAVRARRRLAKLRREEGRSSHVGAIDRRRPSKRTSIDLGRMIS